MVNPYNSRPPAFVYMLAIFRVIFGRASEAMLPVLFRHFFDFTALYIGKVALRRKKGALGRVYLLVLPDPALCFFKDIDRYIADIFCHRYGISFIDRSQKTEDRLVCILGFTLWFCAFKQRSGFAYSAGMFLPDI